MSSQYLSQTYKSYIHTDMKVSGFLLQYDQSETFIIITRQDKKKNIHDEISSSYIYLYSIHTT